MRSRLNLNLARKRLREIETKREALKGRLADWTAEKSKPLHPKAQRALHQERLAISKDLSSEDAALQDLLREIAHHASETASLMQNTLRAWATSPVDSEGDAPD